MLIETEKKSVVMITNSLNINGISEVITSYCRSLDKSKFNITVMAGSPINDKYKEEYAKLNTKIIELPSKTNDAGKYYFEIFRNLKRNRYDIVHVHGNSATMAFDLIIAELCGVKCRIAHCHNSRCLSTTMNKIMLPVFKHVYTKSLACSSLAGEWLFGKNNFTVILNGFDYNKYLYDSQARKSIRKELGIGKEYVIGHMGRMNNQKNQEYILKIFENLCKIRDDVILLMVGDGPNYDKIKNIAKTHKYKDKIILYGETKTPGELYSAFDVFVFPSKYEGFGMAMTEAQVNGLPCIASTEVPKDVVISNNVTFLPIEQDAQTLWVREILKMIDSHKESQRSNINMSEIRKFEMKNVIKILEECYEGR